MKDATSPNPGSGDMYFYEFVGFIAACMALNALAIDIMLPALSGLNADFLLRDPNQSQAIIATYLVGMGLSQLFYGRLFDGSVVPLTLAYVVLGLSALTIVMPTERQGVSGSQVMPV